MYVYGRGETIIRPGWPTDYIVDAGMAQLKKENNLLTSDRTNEEVVCVAHFVVFNLV